MTRTGTAEAAVPCLALDIDLSKVEVALVGVDRTRSSCRSLLVADVGDDLCVTTLDAVTPFACEGSLGSLLDFTYCFIADSVTRGYGLAFFFTVTASAREVACLQHCANFEVRPSLRGDHGPLHGAAHVGGRGVS